MVDCKHCVDVGEVSVTKVSDYPSFVAVAWPPKYLKCAKLGLVC